MRGCSCFNDFLIIIKQQYILNNSNSLSSLSPFLFSYILG